MIVNDPGRWQDFLTREDVKGKPIMEAKSQFLTEQSTYQSSLPSGGTRSITQFDDVYTWYVEWDGSGDEPQSFSAYKNPQGLKYNSKPVYLVELLFDDSSAGAYQFWFLYYGKPTDSNAQQTIPRWNALEWFPAEGDDPLNWRTLSAEELNSKFVNAFSFSPIYNDTNNASTPSGLLPIGIWDINGNDSINGALTPIAVDRANSGALQT